MCCLPGCRPTWGGLGSERGWGELSVSGQAWGPGPRMQSGAIILAPGEDPAPELWSLKVWRAWRLGPWGSRREVGLCGVHQQLLRIRPAAISGTVTWGSEDLLEMHFPTIFEGACDYTRRRGSSQAVVSPWPLVRALWSLQQGTPTWGREKSPSSYPLGH